MDEEGKRRYFAALAPNYNTLTGYTTRDIFAKLLDIHGSKLNITSSSIVHDNACGPGTATEVLLDRYSIASSTCEIQTADADGPPTIIATDYSPGMIDALGNLQTTKSASNRSWSTALTTHVLNSEDLAPIPDNHLTHSVSNFSLFTITNPVQSLREIHRTLQPGGVAVILLWKRFAVQPLLAAAQDHVKGEGYAKKHALPVNGPKYFEKEVVPEQLVEAGFEEEKMETFQMDHFVTDQAGVLGTNERWDGLFRFMTDTRIAAGSIRGFDEDGVQRWPQSVKWAMDEENKKHGGLKFEAWVTIARK